MVALGSPDPPREAYEENLSREDGGQIIMANTSSDEEEEEISHDGYELLSMNPSTMQDSEESDDSSSETDEVVQDNAITAESRTLNNVPNETSLFEPGTSHASIVWSTPSPSNITMDTEQVNQVKEAMASIKLPSSSIPAWAADVSEEQWKEQLLNRLKSLDNKPSK